MRKLAITDAETTPDFDRMPPELIAEYEKDPDNFFPPLPFHKVETISMVVADVRQSIDGKGEWYDVQSLFSSGKDPVGEARILSSFWGWFGANQPRLVTWAGRNFDLPVLRLRAMIHGVQTPGFSPAVGSRGLDYGYRYAKDAHCDLAEVITSFAGRMPKQDHVAKMLGLPGKFNGHGSKVLQLLQEGRRPEVSAYCDGDVLNLFVMYAKYMHMDCRMTPQGHDATMDSLAAYLSSNRERRPHLGEFLDLWQSGPAAARLDIQTVQAPADGPAGNGDVEYPNEPAAVPAPLSA